MDNSSEEVYEINKRSLEELMYLLRRNKASYREENADGQEWLICDAILGKLNRMIPKEKKIKEVREKEVAIHLSVYVPFQNVEVPDDTLIALAMEKLDHSLNRSGLADYQIYDKEVRIAE